MSIDPSALDQVLFVEPTVGFVAVDAALRSVGWAPDGRAPATPPLIPGEPELFGWSWQGGRPRVLMSFNPVARLRALDVAEAPPALRGAIAEALPLVGPSQALGWLKSSDPRDRLRGLWLLRDAEHIEQIDAIDPLIDDDVAEVGAAAWEVKQRLEQLREAQRRARVLMSTLLGMAKPALDRLHHREVLAALKPQEGDMDLIFAPEVAVIAEAHYAELWADMPALEPARVQLVHGAMAGLFRSPNPYAARFPGGYRQVAGWLKPERLWVCWSELGEGGRRTRRDGLVFLKDRWVWLPRPWRAVGDLPIPRSSAGG